MRAGKNVQRVTRSSANDSSNPAVPDGHGASESATQPSTSAAQPSTSNIEPEPKTTNAIPGPSVRASPIPQSAVYQDVLVECNALVEEYRKGKMSKPTVYSKIRAKLASFLEEDTKTLRESTQPL